MTAVVYIVPLLFIGVIVFALIKKVKVYDSFAEGIKGVFPLIMNIFPYIATVFIMTEVFEASGLSAKTVSLLSPFFEKLGIPGELTRLVLIKPFSGNGSLALLTEIYQNYGADSYLARCASVVYGSSETVFYIAAVYFSSVKEKKLFLPVLISLVATFAAVIFGCLLCRVM